MPRLITRDGSTDLPELLVAQLCRMLAGAPMRYLCGPLLLCNMLSAEFIRWGPPSRSCLALINKVAAGHKPDDAKANCSMILTCIFVVEAPHFLAKFCGPLWVYTEKLGLTGTGDYQQIYTKDSQAANRARLEGGIDESKVGVVVGFGVHARADQVLDCQLHGLCISQDLSGQTSQQLLSDQS